MCTARRWTSNEQQVISQHYFLFYCKLCFSTHSYSLQSHHLLLFLICSALSDLRSTLAWQQKLSERKIDMMLLSIPFSGLLAALRAKPMEPQPVISPTKPSYAPSKPKPMSWGTLRSQRWFRRVGVCVCVCVCMCVRECISQLAHTAVQLKSHFAIPTVHLHSLSLPHVWDCQIPWWVARSDIQWGHGKARWRPIHSSADLIHPYWTLLCMDSMNAGKVFVSHTHTTCMHALPPAVHALLVAPLAVIQ